MLVQSKRVQVGSDSLMLQKEWQISVTGSVKARMILLSSRFRKNQVQFVSSLMDLQRGLGRLAIRRKHTLRIQPFQWLSHNNLRWQTVCFSQNQQAF